MFGVNDSPETLLMRAQFEREAAEHARKLRTRSSEQIAISHEQIAIAFEQRANRLSSERESAIRRALSMLRTKVGNVR
jgi:hypothetical protein